MRHFQFISVFMFAFGLGCVAATIAQPFVVPTVHAGTNPQRWEQMCVSHTTANVKSHTWSGFDEPDGWNPVFKKMGQQGWRLVETTSGQHGSLWYACFERPLG